VFLRSEALPGKFVFSDAPAQAREKTRQGCGGRGLHGCVGRRNIFRCYNRYFPIAFPVAVANCRLTAFATLEPCLEPRFRRPRNHHRQSSSSRAGERESIACLAGRVRQRGRRADSGAEFFQRYSARGSCRRGMAAGTHKPCAALSSLDQQVFRDFGEAD